MKWIWKEVAEDRAYCETWICGEPNLGCGVHRIGSGWRGVVVIFNESYRLPVKQTKEEAMADAEGRFDKLYEQYHEVVN